MKAVLFVFSMLASSLAQANEDNTLINNNETEVRTYAGQILGESFWKNDPIAYSQPGLGFSIETQQVGRRHVNYGVLRGLFGTRNGTAICAVEFKVAFGDKQVTGKSHVINCAPK